MNKGMDAANQFQTQQSTPQALAAGGESALGLLGQRQSQAQGLASIIYGQPQVPVGQSPLNMLGQVGGMFAGGLGGGGGGSSLPYGYNPGTYNTGYQTNPIQSTQGPNTISFNNEKEK